MDDTVKLIIEISKDQYKARQNWVTNPKRMVDEVDIAIAHGIPLDDVKAEIDKAQEPYMTSTAYDEGVRFGLMLAYQIVDKCKAESEDTVRNARKVTKKDSHKEWWDSFYKGEIKPNE